MSGDDRARRWLSDRVPTLVSGGVDGHVDVDGGTTSVPEGVGGRPADQPEHHGDLDGAVAAVARALRTLHDLDPSGAPLATGWEDLERDIELAGIVDTDRLPEPYSRYRTEDLRSIWVGGRPATEDLVVCHGHPTLDRFRIETEPSSSGRVEVCAIVDADRFRVADRHLDLAIVQQSLLAVYGFDAVVLFYEHYGHEPDMLRLDHYVLAGLLLDGPVERG